MISEILNGLRILLVEDIRVNQLLIANILRSAGAEVALAEDGAEGIKKAINGSFDLILMDIQMPVLDGFEATRRLRELGFELPIVALTALKAETDIDRCYTSGCVGYIQKPVESKLLIEYVAKFARAKNNDQAI